MRIHLHTCSSVLPCYRQWDYQQGLGMKQITSLDFSKCYIEQLNAEQLRQANSILYSAYHDDPLFMQIFQSDKPDFEARLRAAIREEIAAFWDKKQPLLGLFYDEQLLGVACLTEPDAGFQGERLWHWRLKMLLTAGYLSSQQMLEKERRVHEAMPATAYHMLAFIARNPAYFHPDAMSHFLKAIDHWVDQQPGSEGVGVFVTLDRYLPFFHQDHYEVVGQLDFRQVSGKLLFRRRQQLQEP
jgi:hypothetical protein